MGFWSRCRLAASSRSSGVSRFLVLLGIGRRPQAGGQSHIEEVQKSGGSSKSHRGVKCGPLRGRSCIVWCGCIHWSLTERRPVRLIATSSRGNIRRTGVAATLPGRMLWKDRSSGGTAARIGNSREFSSAASVVARFRLNTANAAAVHV